MKSSTHRDLPTERGVASEADSLRTAVWGVARSWYIVLIAALAAVGASLVYSDSRPTGYESAVSLTFEDAPFQQVVAGSSTPVDAPRRLNTAADLIRLPEVRRRVARRLRRDDRFRPAGSDVAPEFSSTSDILRIVARARDASSAALLANTTADVFLAYRRQLSERSLRETRRLLNEQIQAAPTRAERRALVAKRNNLDATQALDDKQIQIVQRGIPPAAAVSANKVRNAVIALVLGAALGIAIAMLRTPVPRAPIMAPPLAEPWSREEPTIRPQAGSSRTDRP
jgi:uncharacterized protein involved in exopolysaccharide biosynthesis